MFATIGYYICIPYAWLLRALYELTSSYGWALVLFTVVIKLIMLPFQMKSKKSMMRMSRFQPMIKEIQTRSKNNQVKMNEELETSVSGLHCLGDSSGWTRGLMMASVMGVLMGRKIVRDEKQ